MKHLKLKILSNNVKAHNYFLSSFSSFKFKKLNFELISKIQKPIKKKKIISILKAPHVYKAAQEQFVAFKYKTYFSIKTTNCIKFLKLLKKVKSEKFLDTFFFLTFSTENFQKTLNLNNSYLNLLTKNYSKKTSNFNFLTRDNNKTRHQKVCNYLKTVNI